MIVCRDLAEYPHDHAVVLTLGTFDGVHLGHEKILERVLSTARMHALPSVLLTFDPHPREVIGRSGGPTYLLSTIDERIERIAALGIDTCVVLPFTRDLSMLDAATFFHDYCIGRLHARHIVVGVDHAFGKGRSGTVEELRRLGETHAVDVQVVGERLMDGVKVSSSAIRRALDEGMPRQAAQFLGRPYSFTGVVVRGEGVGSTLGFPTANIDASHPGKLLPKHGVYVVDVHVLDESGTGASHAGVMNIGIRPTISQQMHLSLEVHILEFSGDLYGNRLRVDVLDRLRDEIRFDSREQLQAQIRSDIERAQEWRARTLQR